MLDENNLGTLTERPQLPSFLKREVRSRSTGTRSVFFQDQGKTVPSKEKIDQYYSKLHDLIENFDANTKKVLGEQQEIFFSSFRDLMKTIEKDFRQIRLVIDKREAVHQSELEEAGMDLIKKQLSYFRDESLHLSKELKQARETIEKLRRDKNLLESEIECQKKSRKATLQTESSKFDTCLTLADIPFEANEKMMTTGSDLNGNATTSDPFTLTFAPENPMFCNRVSWTKLDELLNIRNHFYHCLKMFVPSNQIDSVVLSLLNPIEKLFYETKKGASMKSQPSLQTTNHTQRVGNTTKDTPFEKNGLTKSKSKIKIIDFLNSNKGGTTENRGRVSLDKIKSSTQILRELFVNESLSSRNVSVSPFDENEIHDLIPQTIYPNPLQNITNRLLNIPLKPNVEPKCPVLGIHLSNPSIPTTEENENGLKRTSSQYLVKPPVQMPKLKVRSQSRQNVLKEFLAEKHLNFSQERDLKEDFKPRSKSMRSDIRKFLAVGGPLRE